jgi:hypothetical protein
LDFPTVYGSAKTTGCLTIGKTLTDNVEALLDMVVKMFQLLKFLKELLKC